MSSSSRLDCPLCDASFIKPNSFINHIQMDHPRGKSTVASSLKKEVENTVTTGWDQGVPTKDTLGNGNCNTVPTGSDHGLNSNNVVVKIMAEEEEGSTVDSCTPGMEKDCVSTVDYSSCTPSLDQEEISIMDTIASDKSTVDSCTPSMEEYSESTVDYTDNEEDEEPLTAEELFLLEENRRYGDEIRLKARLEKEQAAKTSDSLEHSVNNEQNETLDSLEHLVNNKQNEAIYGVERSIKDSFDNLEHSDNYEQNESLDSLEHSANNEPNEPLDSVKHNSANNEPNEPMDSVKHSANYEPNEPMDSLEHSYNYEQNESLDSLDYSANHEQSEPLDSLKHSVNNEPNEPMDSLKHSANNEQNEPLDSLEYSVNNEQNKPPDSLEHSIKDENEAMHSTVGSDVDHVKEHRPQLKLQLTQYSFVLIEPFIKHECKECNTIYTSKYALNKHQCKKRSFDCPRCSKSFNEQVNLRRHHTVVHKNNSSDLTKQYKCKYCTKCFVNKANMKIHSALVHRDNIDGKTTVCGHCDKTYSSIGNLNQHIRNCHSLDKDFKLKSEVEENYDENAAKGETPENAKFEGTETKENTFGLQNDTRNMTVDASSSTNISIKRTHSNKCPHCSKNFANSRILKRHINEIHLLLTPFACRKCDLKFSRSEKLNNHMVKYHKEEESGSFLA